MIPLIGKDTIMWGSDYPYPDAIWPDSQKWIAVAFAGVSPAVQTQGHLRERRPALRTLV